LRPKTAQKKNNAVFDGMLNCHQSIAVKLSLLRKRELAQEQMAKD
jgi:hypothetical protein